MTSVFQPQFTITNRMTQPITRIKRARHFLDAALLSAELTRAKTYASAQYVFGLPIEVILWRV